MSKYFNALWSCTIKIFMNSSNVKFVIDSTLRVSFKTNFYHWTRPWIYINYTLRAIIYLYLATESPRSIGTRVHLELTIIKSGYGSLEVIMVSSRTSAFYSAKKRRSWMNYPEKNVKIFSCIVKLHDKNIHGLFQCEVRYRLDALRLVHNKLHSWTRPWIYSASKIDE